MNNEKELEKIELKSIIELDNIEDAKEVQEKLIKWVNDHKKYFSDNPNFHLNISVSDKSNITEEDYKELFKDFEIDARHLILSDINRKTFVIRHEELFTSIKSTQEKLDSYDNYVKEHGGGKEGEEAAMKHFLNSELTEFSQIRTQVIPMLMMELETLATAIEANYNTIEITKSKVKNELIVILSYLKGKILKDEYN